jgi:hypothetical protein
MRARQYHGNKGNRVIFSYFMREPKKVSWFPVTGWNYTHSNYRDLEK